MPTRSPSITADFESLFRGRTDIWFDCINDRRGDGHLGMRGYEAHLHGDQPIGVYNLREDSTVWWSATDIDVDKPIWVEMLADVWKHYGFETWAETSRSKGWHLWLFHPAPVSAETARNAWLWVHEVSGVPATEVYPKQTFGGVKEDGTPSYGNCIRLPYHKHHERGRQVAYESNLATPIELDQFLKRALRGRREHTGDLDELASMYSFPEWVPPTEQPVFKGIGGGNDQRISQIYRGQGRVVEGERDSTFWCLACFAAGIGHTEQEILDICTQVYQTQTDQSGFTLNDALKKVPRAFATVQRRQNARGRTADRTHGQRR